METILEQLGLGTLLERFSDEKWDPHVRIGHVGKCSNSLRGCDHG